MLTRQVRKRMLAKVQDWISKGKKEADVFDRYVSYFIAFNIMYNLYAKELRHSVDFTTGDKQRALEVSNLISNPSPVIAKLKKSLEAYLPLIPMFREEFWDKKETIPIAKNLKEAYEAGNDHDILRFLLMWLYKVRCNLVHGEKEYNQADQVKILRGGNKLLAEILASLVTEYQGRYRSN